MKFYKFICLLLTIQIIVLICCGISANATETETEPEYTHPILTDGKVILSLKAEGTKVKLHFELNDAAQKAGIWGTGLFTLSYDPLKAGIKGSDFRPNAFFDEGWTAAGGTRARDWRIRYDNEDGKIIFSFYYPYPSNDSKYSIYKSGYVLEFDFELKNGADSFEVCLINSKFDREPPSIYSNIIAPDDHYYRIPYDINSDYVKVPPVQTTTKTETTYGTTTTSGDDPGDKNTSLAFPNMIFIVLTMSVFVLLFSKKYRVTLK